MILSLLLSSFLTLVELNCENLFDCKHDSLKQDSAEHGWQDHRGGAQRGQAALRRKHHRSGRSGE